MRAARKQADRSAETQRALIESATVLLQSIGYAGTTTALIARHAGLTTGALHHHYSSKDDLMLGVLDRASERVARGLDMIVHAGGETVNVHDLIRHLWEIYGDPEYWAIWEIIIGTRKDAEFHTKVIAHRQETMQRILYPWVAKNIISHPKMHEYGSLFEFMLIAIRGLSLERFLDKPPEYFEKNLLLLTEMVEWKLAAIRSTQQ